MDLLAQDFLHFKLIYFLFRTLAFSRNLKPICFIPQKNRAFEAIITKLFTNRLMNRFLVLPFPGFFFGGGGGLSPL